MENDILEGVFPAETPGEMPSGMPGETPDFEITVGKRKRLFQYRAVILLLVLLIPALIATYQLVSNHMSNEWVHAVQPHLPQLDSVITF